MRFFNQEGATPHEGNMFHTEADNEGTLAVEAFLFNSSQPHA